MFNFGGGNFVICFILREFGDYFVNVCFDGFYIFGSFFKIRVGGVEGYLEKVKVYGEGLSKGRVGEVVEFIVNVLEVGLGVFVFFVDGFVKVKMNCSENVDGIY